MDYFTLVEQRRSIRDFKDRDVSADQLEEIRGYFQGCRRLDPELSMDIQFYDSAIQKKLEGIAGYKGFVIGAPHYILVLSEAAGHYVENAGYACEDLLLKLADMGLDSCWLTFRDAQAMKEALCIESELSPVALLAYGYGKREKELRHLNIKSPSDVSIVVREEHVAPKLSVNDMVYYQEWGENAELTVYIADNGLRRAFYAACLSPTYLNRQPYRFILDEGTVVLIQTEDEMTDEYNAELNLGIVMLNFAAVLSQRRPDEPKWIFGEPQKHYEIPDGCQIVAYCLV